MEFRIWLSTGFSGGTFWMTHDAPRDNRNTDEVAEYK